MTEPQPAIMSIYRVTNRETGEVRLVPAESQQAAVERLGWLIVECHVIRVQPSFERPFHRQATFMVAVPCRVCHAQYASCNLPDGTDCHLLEGAPDVAEWLKQTLRAHQCDHVGEPLGIADYKKRQSFMPTSDAIAYLLARLL